jgi:hypothetical protein
LLQFAVRDALSSFGFGGQDAGSGLFVDFFFGSHCEAAGELLIADMLGDSQKGQERVDLLPRQGVDDLMKAVQVTHDSLHCRRCTSSVYRDSRRRVRWCSCSFGPSRAELREVRESLALIGARASGIRTSLQSLQGAQGARGLNLRGDMQAAANLMNTYLDGAEAALNAGDVAQARSFLDKAEPQVQKLEKFLNR